MAAPPLRIPLSLNMEEFERNIEKAKGHTLQVTQFIVKRFIDVNATVLATAGAAGTTALAFRAMLSAIAPLSVAVAGIVGVFKLMGTATELAKEQIEAFNETAQQAAKAGLSTDIFQRLTRSGEALKLTVEEVGEALTRFNNQATDRLGGGYLQQRLKELAGAGNFSGNAGALESAVGTEAKYRAIVALISDALEKGERLAAIDLAEKAFGPKVAENLRANSSFLREMLENADKLSSTKIISDEQLATAISLKTRLEESEKVLREKFKPVQDDLAKLGMQYQESWVGIYENLAAAVTQANKLYDFLKEIPDIFARAGNSSFFDKLTAASGSLGLNSRPEGLLLRGEEGFGSNTSSDSPAIRALRAALNNPSAIQQAMRQTAEIQSKVRGDTSTAPSAKKDEAAAFRLDQVQRYINAQQKSLEVSEAELRTIGMSNEQRARAIALAEAQAAARARGKPLTDLEVAAVERYATAVAQLQERLSTIRPLERFANDAANLNRQLVDASIGGFRSLEDGFVSIIDGTKSTKEAFSDMARSILADLARIAIRQALIAPLARGLLGMFGGGGELPGFGTDSFIGPRLAQGGVIPAGGLALVSEHSPGGGRFIRAGSEPITVTPNDVVRRDAGSTNSFVYSPVIDARGADATAVARLAAAQANAQKNFDRNVISVITRVRNNTPGFLST